MSVGGVEPETVERYLVWVCGGCDVCDPPDGDVGRPMPCTHEAPSVDGAYVVKVEAYDAVVDRLRSAEDELRLERDLRRRAERSRENANRVLRQAREEEASWERAYDSTIDELHDTQAKLSMARAGAKADWDGLDRQVKLRDVAEQALIAAEADRDRLAEALRQAREERDAMREMYARSVAARVDYLAARDAAEADRDRLAGALRHARGCITEQIGPMPTPSQRLALDTIEAALSPVQGEHEQDGESLKFGGRAAARPWPGSGLPPGANAGCLAPGPCSCGLPKATLPPYGDRTASGGQGVRNDDSEATR